MIWTTIHSDHESDTRSQLDLIVFETSEAQIHFLEVRLLCWKGDRSTWDENRVIIASYSGSENQR